MMKKLNTETFDVYEVKVNMEGDVQNYALNFLKIFNTVKTQEDLIRVTNDYGNGVQVVCKPDALESTKEYLSNFGEVTTVDKVLCVEICEDPKYDYDVYEDLVVVPYME